MNQKQIADVINLKLQRRNGQYYVERWGDETFKPHMQPSLDNAQRWAELNGYQLNLPTHLDRVNNAPVAMVKYQEQSSILSELNPQETQQPTQSDLPLTDEQKAGLSDFLSEHGYQIAPIEKKPENEQVNVSDGHEIENLNARVQSKWGRL